MAHPSTLSSDENAITLTNDEATCSKRHAVSLKYWKDPYITMVCKQNIRKTPEISRGYFARVFAVRSLVEQFVSVRDLFNIINQNTADNNKVRSPAVVVAVAAAAVGAC